MKKAISAVITLFACDLSMAAAGGAYGENGTEIFFGGKEYAQQTNSSGANGADVNGREVIKSGLNITGSNGLAGGFIPSGGGGAGGLGGGAIYGAVSYGSAAGGSGESNAGGAGGETSHNRVTLVSSSITGGAGGNGGNGGSTGWDSYAAAGEGGHGGASVFGSLSVGGAGGGAGNKRNGGNGGNSIGNNISVKGALLKGKNARGGDGGAAPNASGNGGYGGGSIYGAVSSGGGGGGAHNVPDGGSGGSLSGHIVFVESTTLEGGDGGNGGGGANDGAGSGGHGGGSIFGAISSGAAGGNDGKGGAGGEASGNQIAVINSVLHGGIGGQGGATNNDGSGAGAGGHGGGSVFGGVSTGAAGGNGNGKAGDGGNTSRNEITLIDVQLIGAAAGVGGAASTGEDGLAGLEGGSVFGGVSFGGAGGRGAGGYGGDGGNANENKITISGITNISGDIYGGYTQGGNSGTANFYGEGKLAAGNMVTIIGDQVTVGGSLYGGMSLNGSTGLENKDPTYNSFYQGNTINFQSGHFKLNGEMRNFQNYNWLLPEDEFDGDVIVEVLGTPVNIEHTIHKVDVDATGNTLRPGDRVILIDQVSGDFDREKSSAYLEQGFFVVYDAEMDVKEEKGKDALVLTVLGATDGDPDGKPAGEIHPESEEFLKGRSAQLAFVDQGADMISDGISYARASLRKENANVFAIMDGGSSKYEQGGSSSFKLHDFRFALGAAKAFELESKSVAMFGAFFEHGSGDYRSRNEFDYFGEIRGSGKLRYRGLGALFHMDVADTDVSKVSNKPNIFDDKYGLYLDAAVRFGHARVDFHSSDMVNGEGVEARYKTKSRYSSVIAGLGYVWTMDEQQAMDFYGRVTYSRLNGKDVQVIDEQMGLGAAHSQRLRVGTRYGYAYSDKVTPYAGLAYEHNFKGDVSGSAYGLTIKENSLKGSTGIVEAGLMVKPRGGDDPLSLHFGVSGYFGDRKGGTAALRVRHVF